MSKNLTRKGLAFGALLALGSSVFAGVPANAAGESTAVTLSYAGTGTTVLEGADFGLTATLDSAHTFYNSSLQQYSPVYLAYVDTDGADSANYQWVPIGTPYDLTPNYHSTGSCGNDCYDSLAGVVTLGTGNQIGGSTYRDITDELRYKVTAKSAGFDVNYVTTYSNDYGYLSAVDNSFSTGYHQSGETARFEVEGISADKTAEIQSYVDLNDNGALDSNEPTGAAKTITWANHVASNVTVTVDQPVLGAHQLITSKVTFPAGYNATQIADDIEARFFRNSNWIDTNSYSYTDGTTVAGTWYCNVDPGIYWVQAMILPWDNEPGATRSQIGNTAITTVADGSALQNGVRFESQATATVNTDNHVKAGTKSFDVTATVIKDNEPVKTAGQKVKFTVSEGTLDSTTTITVGGKTLKHSGSAVTVEALTDANGVAKLTINSDTGLKGDSVNLAADVILNATAGTYTSNWATTSYSWTATDAVKAIIEEHSSKSYTADGNIVVKPGSTYALNYTISDEWGTAPTGRFSIEVYKDNGYNYNSPTYVDKEVEFVNGKASVSVTDLSGPNRMYVLTGDVYKWNATSSVTGAFSDDQSLSISTRVDTRDDVTAAGISATLDNGGNWGSTSNPLPISSHEFGNWDMRLSWNSLLDNDGDEPDVEDDSVYLTGIVTDKNGVPLPGVAVTAKLAGASFIVGGYGYDSNQTHDDDNVTVGEATIFTNEDGYYKFEVASHKSGENVVTISSGAASTTKTINVAYPTTTSSSSVLTVSGAAGYVPGTAVPVTAKLVDKWGNGFKGATVNFTVAGIGYFTTTSAVADANGVATTNLVTTPLQPGTAVVTATATANSGKTLTATANVVVASPEPAAIVNVVGHRVYVKFSNSRGEEVSAVIGGVRVTKTAAYDNYVLSRVIKKAGKYSVKAYVAGDLVKASTVTVK